MVEIHSSAYGVLQKTLCLFPVEGVPSVLSLEKVPVWDLLNSAAKCVFSFTAFGLIFSKSFLYLYCLQGEQTLWVLMALDNLRNLFHKLLVLACFAASSLFLFSKDILLVSDTFALLFGPAGFLSALPSPLCDTPYVLLSLQTSC